MPEIDSPREGPYPFKAYQVPAPFEVDSHSSTGTSEEFFITVLADSSIEEALDVSYFGEFRPPMTFKQAVKAFGEPESIRKEQDSLFYVYAGPRGRIEIGKLANHGSTGIHRKWTLRAYPEKSSVHTLLPEFIASREPPEGILETHYHFVNKRGYREITATVREARVEFLTWEHPWIPFSDDEPR